MEGRRSLTFIGLLLVVHSLMSAKCHGTYRTLGDMLHWYSHSAQLHQSIMRYAELKEPGYDHVMMPLVTLSNFGSGNASQPEKPSVLLVFGEHARELITCEVGLWLSRVLVGDTAELFSWSEWPAGFQALGIMPEAVPSTVQEWTKRILDNLVLKILPVENMDGRQSWEAGNLCLRKTSRGVDLNRNYPFAFANEPPNSEMYGGAHPFSEAQSRMIARLALEGGRVPKAYINVHSGEWAVYSGWDSKAAVGPGLPADLSELLKKSGDMCRCQAGPAGAVSNYLAFGTGMDFMYTQLGVPYALTYEVYGSTPGGGMPGMLSPGATNRPLDSFPYTSDERIAHTVPRIEDLLPPPHLHRARQHMARARKAAAAMTRRIGMEGAATEEEAVAAAAAGGDGGLAATRLQGSQQGPGNGGTGVVRPLGGTRHRRRRSAGARQMLGRGEAEAAGQLHALQAAGVGAGAVGSAGAFTGVRKGDAEYGGGLGGRRLRAAEHGDAVLARVGPADGEAGRAAYEDEGARDEASEHDGELVNAEEADDDDDNAVWIDPSEVDGQQEAALEAEVEQQQEQQGGFSAGTSLLSLGGRSMRRLAAAAAAAVSDVGLADGALAKAEAAVLDSLAGSDAMAAAAGDTSGALGTVDGGAGRKVLEADVASFTGPDGPIVAMVRSKMHYHQSCFDMFNPPPGSAYRDVISRWVAMLLMTLSHVADPENPRPSPHPLPDTVLAGAGASTGATWAARRRQLLAFQGGAGQMEEDAGDGEAGEGAAMGGVFQGSRGSGRGGIEDRDGSMEAERAAEREVEDVERIEGAVVAAEVDVGARTGQGLGGAPGDGSEGDTGAAAYGSDGFDRRVWQGTYEVDPVMRQHSLVVFVALCCLVGVVVPWWLSIMRGPGMYGRPAAGTSANGRGRPTARPAAYA